MRIQAPSALLSFLCLAGLPPLIAQDPPPPDPARLAHLLDALGSSDWRLRDDASRSLLELGATVSERLRALRHEVPLEARLRIDAILGELEGPRRKVRAPFAATPIRLDLVDLPLHEAAHRLGQAAGVVVKPAGARAHAVPAERAGEGPERRYSARWERPFSLTLQCGSFFEALDRFCERAGLAFQREHPTGHIVLTEGAVENGLVRHAGPARVAITSLMISRQTRFSGSPSTSASLQVRVDVEDAAPCLGILQPIQVADASDDQGRSVAFRSPGSAGRYLMAFDRRRQGYFSASFDPPERDAAYLKDVVIPIEVVLADEMLTSEVFVAEPVDDAPERPGEGPIDLRVDGFLPGPPHVLTISFVAVPAEPLTGVTNVPSLEEIEVLSHAGQVIPHRGIQASQAHGREVRALTLPEDASVLAVRVRLLARCRIERLDARFDRVDLP